MNKIETEILKSQNALNKIIAFNTKYGDALEGCVREVYPTLAKIELRDPAKVGLVLGKHDWTRTPNYWKTYFDWSTERLDVKITIENAEEIPVPEARPVEPRDFPLLLEEAKDPVPTPLDFESSDPAF